MSFDFFPNEESAALLNAVRHPSLVPDPGVWDGFTSGAGRYTMRSLAEAGRAIDMLGAVGPIVQDKITGGTEAQDQYFREHDEVFNNAVDYWTPKPGEVGTAGQIAGQLAGGILQAVASPALLVGTSQLSTGEDLVRQGVDAGAANVVGDIAGTGAAFGLKLPFLGKSLASRLLSGAAGNVVQGAATAGASHAILDSAGSPQQAAQFNPWDLRARILDVMLGAAFGGLAHIEAKLTPTDTAAILVANQARHMEDTTSPGRPVADTDATAHAEAIQRAVGQVLRGEQVTVDPIIKDMRTVLDASQWRDRTDVVEEAQRIAAQDAPAAAPIPADLSPHQGGPVLDVHIADPTTLRALRAARETPDLLIPSSDTAGNPVSLRAADAIANADMQVKVAETISGNLFKTAANCLLGVL